ncbi:MAG: glycine cleavage system aminomethyltransferase GcvT [bacterium]|nr:glycine cleavage system aminomethyltransferase GcvT [bacterium]
MKYTTLYKKHIEAGAKVIEFAGFALPLQYAGIIKEHLWCRNSCSIFDTSHMTKFFLKGKNISLEMSNILTISVNSMETGQCRYCFILNERGGIIDDVVVYKFSDEEYMVVSNASTKEKVKKWYTTHTREIEIQDADIYFDKIDVQGPLSKDVLKDIFKIDLSSLSFYRFGKFDISKKEVIVSYSGYTGGRGYEIYVAKEDTEELWNLLLQDKRVQPAGLGARDSLRLEAGLPLYGNELDEETTPFEAGMEKFIDFSHDFIGKNALEFSKPQKKIVYFISETRQSPRHGYKIFIEDIEAGYVTSGCFSPSLQKGIGIGYIKKGFTTPEIAYVSDRCVKIICSIVSKGYFKKLIGIRR